MRELEVFVQIPQALELLFNTTIDRKRREGFYDFKASLCTN